MAFREIRFSESPLFRKSDFRVVDLSENQVFRMSNFRVIKFLRTRIFEELTFQKIKFPKNRTFEELISQCNFMRFRKYFSDKFLRNKFAAVSRSFNSHMISIWYYWHAHNEAINTVNNSNKLVKWSELRQVGGFTCCRLFRGWWIVRNLLLLSVTDQRSIDRHRQPKWPLSDSKTSDSNKSSKFR